MDSRKKWKKTVDSDDEVPLFPEGWAPKAERVDSDDEVPLFSEGWAPKEKRDSDDDVPLFPEGCKRKAKQMRREQRREKSVPKSTRLDSALERMQAGAAEVNLMRLLPRANMDDKLTSLITYVIQREDTSARQQHRVTGDSAWNVQWNAKVAECTRQVAARAAYSVSWIDWNRPGRL